VALEADWIDTYRLNSFIKEHGRDSSVASFYLKQYDRLPQWLWANEEFLQLLLGLKRYNDSNQNKMNINGLNLYSFKEVLDTLATNLTDNSLKPLILICKQCLELFKNDATDCQKAVRNGTSNCSAAINNLRLSINKKMPLNMKALFFKCKMLL
jgi:erythromycin esterase-like protein